MIGERLKEERKRLGSNQDGFAGLANVSRRAYAEWEAGNTSPTAVQLAALAAAGVDVQYIVTGKRQGYGIGESAVHQAVLDAVDLLSLDKKVDASQLAKAVVKLCARHSAPPTTPGSVTNQQNVHGGQAHQYNAPISGGVAGRDIVNKGRK